MKYTVEELLDENEKSPYRMWVDDLDVKSKARIQARVLRFAQGNLGDSKSVGDGVFEARFFFGPGYRLYFGVIDGKIVLLLCGGDKSSQKRDISKAKTALRDFLKA
ncbi:type II toxin-antitoxin system RelE/ParE family toxin [Bdellovibrionales bacterium]|nr:type II toxin-antitoxin system RelE/ParE family toxin [Bdellovibrionales bacterium]